VDEQYPLVFHGRTDLLAVLDDIDAPVRAETTTLAALRYAPSATPIPPLVEWPTPLTSDGSWEFDVAEEWFVHGLLTVHPDSPLAGFSWRPSREEALAAADGDPQALPEPTCPGFWPTRVPWYVPHATSMGTGAERLDVALTERLNPVRMTAARRETLLDLASDLIAAETVRCFEFQLDTHNLPEVPANHRARMMQAATRLSRLRSVGEGYNVAWRAARDAAAAAQRQPRAPKANMTTYGVNVFESHAQQALDPDHELRCYQQDSRVPLAPLTRTVFHTILALDPFTTSRRDIEQHFPPPPPASLAASAEQLRTRSPQSRSPQRRSPRRPPTRSPR
jgi:hypothetical protein